VQHAAHLSLAERRLYRETVAEEPGVTDRLAAVELDKLFDYTYFVREVDKSFARMGLIGD
jgi:hypothetical protein